jgi:VanZ family protein
VKSVKPPPVASPLPATTVAPTSHNKWLIGFVRESRFGLVLLYLGSAICGVLLFVGGPDYHSPPSYRGVWSFGHIITFFLWTLVLIRNSAWFAGKPINQQIPIGVVMTLSLGFAIEWLQTFVGRTFSVGDVARDLTGGFLAIAFLSPAREALAWMVLRTIQASALALIFVQIYPVALTLADELIAEGQFPILSDLETPLELSRWKSGSELSIDTQVVRQGRASLRARLMPGRYAGLGLFHFPENWRGYSSLRFSVLNGSRAPVVMTCRINDAQHFRNGEAYSDRFNEHFKLDPGWNEIIIPLNRIENAPRGRRMDLAQVKAIVLFIKDLRVPLVLNIDAVRLE